jgi:iron-sulfur cluster insertion protein
MTRQSAKNALYSKSGVYMSLLAITRKNKDQPKQRVVNEPLPEIEANQVLVSESAAERILRLLGEQNPTGVMRVGIVGGGCSGYSYHFAIEDAPRANDFVFENLSARICVDPKSIKLIGGSVLEWHDSMKRSGFALRSKRETKSCSCGESFSL